MEATNKKYVKGFNASYIIAEHKPKLIDALLKSEITNDFMKGMRDGRMTFDKERTKHLSKKKSRLQELNNLKSDKKRDKGQDLGL